MLLWKDISKRVDKFQKSVQKNNGHCCGMSGTSWEHLLRYSSDQNLASQCIPALVIPKYTEWNDHFQYPNPDGETDYDYERWTSLMESEEDPDCEETPNFWNYQEGRPAKFKGLRWNWPLALKIRTFGGPSYFLLTDRVTKEMVTDHIKHLEEVQIETKHSSLLQTLSAKLVKRLTKSTIGRRELARLNIPVGTGRSSSRRSRSGLRQVVVQNSPVDSSLLSSTGSVVYVSPTTYEALRNTMTPTPPSVSDASTISPASTTRRRTRPRRR